MAREAERPLDGSGWLPEVLRYRADEPGQDGGGSGPGEAGIVGANQSEGAAVALPAFLVQDVDEELLAACPQTGARGRLDAAK